MNSKWKRTQQRYWKAKHGVFKTQKSKKQHFHKMCHLGFWRAANIKWTTLFPFKHYLKQSFTCTQRACVPQHMCAEMLWVGGKDFVPGATEVASVRRCHKCPPRPTELKPVSSKMDPPQAKAKSMSNHNSSSGIMHSRWGKIAGPTTEAQQRSKNRWEEQLCTHQGQ